MRRFAVLAASAALALAGCGGDDNERAPPRRAAPSPTAGGGGAKLAIAADPDGAKKFTKTTLTTRRPARSRSTSPTSPRCRTRSRSRATASRRRPTRSPARTRRRSRSTSSPASTRTTARSATTGRRAWRDAHRQVSSTRAVVEDPLEVARHEQRGARLAERAERQRVADGVAHHRVPRAVGLELVRVVPEPYGPCSWASTKRSPGTHSSIRVSQRIGSRCRRQPVLDQRPGAHLDRSRGDDPEARATRA